MARQTMGEDGDGNAIRMIRDAASGEETEAPKSDHFNAEATRGLKNPL
jgi:hypothetical protein